MGWCDWCPVRGIQVQPIHTWLDDQVEFHKWQVDKLEAAVNDHLPLLLNQPVQPVDIAHIDFRIAKRDKKPIDNVVWNHKWLIRCSRLAALVLRNKLSDARDLAVKYCGRNDAFSHQVKRLQRGTRQGNVH